MKGLIPGLNVKILARAIHAMSKIGDDLYIESLPSGIIFRTINSAESAYCMIMFNKSFFTYYNHDYFVTEDDQGLKCKISMKSALTVFKSPSHIDKQVEMCEIKLDPETSKLLFQLRCKHGITKTHFVSILECKKMEATYTKETVPNKLSVHHKVFADVVANFQTSEDQMTFEVNPHMFLLRNYVNINIDLTKMTRTQLSLKPAEFDTYSINSDTTITFSMKEFRALLLFAENVNLPIILHFETSGKPAVFIVKNDSTLEANFVMATERSGNSTQTTENSQKSNTTNRKKISKNNVLDEDSHLFNHIDIPEDSFHKDTSNSIINNANNNTSESPLLSQVSKIKTVFRRCFESTIIQDNQKTYHSVLADDSDGE